MYIAHVLLNAIILLLLLWIGMFLTTLVHEIGHAVMYRIFFRDKDWHITIGTGRTIIKLKKFTVGVFQKTGHFNFVYKNKGSKFQYIMMFLGGPLANIVLIILLRFLVQIIKAKEVTFEQSNLVWFLTIMFWMNVGQFVSAVIPIKFSFWPFNGYISDGLRIFKKATETSNS